VPTRFTVDIMAHTAYAEWQHRKRRSGWHTVASNVTGCVMH